MGVVKWKEFSELTFIRNYYVRDENGVQTVIDLQRRGHE